MECIICVFCIDVCDDVMDKFGCDCGLIDYFVLFDVLCEEVGEKLRFIWYYVLCCCMVFYMVIWFLVGFVMVYVFFMWFEIEMMVVFVCNLIFVILFDGFI